MQLKKNQTQNLMAGRRDICKRHKTVTDFQSLRGNTEC